MTIALLAIPILILLAVTASAWKILNAVNTLNTRAMDTNTHLTKLQDDVTTLSGVVSTTLTNNAAAQAHTADIEQQLADARAAAAANDPTALNAALDQMDTSLIDLSGKLTAIQGAVGTAPGNSAPADGTTTAPATT